MPLSGVFLLETMKLKELIEGNTYDRGGELVTYTGTATDVETGKTLAVIESAENGEDVCNPRELKLTSGGYPAPDWEDPYFGDGY